MKSSVDNIWPADKKADVSRFIEEVASLSSELDDPKLKQKMDDAVRQYQVAQQILSSPAPEVLLKDLPECCLDGRLGEVCVSRLRDLPRAYAWPSLLAAASALIDRRAPGVRTNLYVSLVGPVHSGKSQAIERTCRVLGVEPPVLLDCLSGSGEQLLRQTKDAAGNPRLFAPDELGHLFSKMQIERSSYSYILNRAFYQDRFPVHMGNRESATFDTVLSILGGIVEEKFQDLFDAVSTAGLYDRFAFGVCPGGFVYDYFPLESGHEQIVPACVSVHRFVHEFKAAWRKEHSDLNPRLIEIGIRCAVICAACDGKRVVNVADLSPHLEFVLYQHRVRELLKPNTGVSLEGKLAHKMLTYLERLGGRFVSQRTMFHNIRAYDFGPSVADRALSVLHANGEVELQKAGRQKLIRRVLPPEDFDLQSEVPS